uniref:Uncharacterized protein n=1 Tax=Arion vulgaris TaxID=1028688 RepID=A0A0B6Z8P1_9EUPU
MFKPWLINSSRKKLLYQNSHFPGGSSCPPLPQRINDHEDKNFREIPQVICQSPMRNMIQQISSHFNVTDTEEAVGLVKGGSVRTTST